MKAKHTNHKQKTYKYITYR